MSLTGKLEDHYPSVDSLTVTFDVVVFQHLNENDDAALDEKVDGSEDEP